jgi:geranylgeranyl pyrophosphate synthase
MNRDRSRILKELISKEKLSLREIEMIRTVIRESGGLEKAKETSKKHAEKAKSLFAKTRLQSDVKDFFYNVIDYIKESLDWYE